MKYKPFPGTKFGITDVDLINEPSITKSLQDAIKLMVNVEDSAVAAYIKAQTDFLTSEGKDITEYTLVRQHVADRVIYRVVRIDDLKDDE